LELLIDLIVSVVYIAINVLQLLMLARAILSWIPKDEDSALDRFLYAATEPLIEPVRNVLDRFEFFQGLPIDFSFMATVLLLSLIWLILPPVTF